MLRKEHGETLGAEILIALWYVEAIISFISKNTWAVFQYTCISWFILIYSFLLTDFIFSCIHYLSIVLFLYSWLGWGGIFQGLCRITQETSRTWFTPCSSSSASKAEAITSSKTEAKTCSILVQSAVGVAIAAAAAVAILGHFYKVRRKMK